MRKESVFEKMSMFEINELPAWERFKFKREYAIWREEERKRDLNKFTKRRK